MNGSILGLSREARLYLRRENRQRAWKWAKKGLKPGMSVWRLEWIKAAVAFADKKLILLPPSIENKSIPLSRWRVALGLAIGCFMAFVYILLQRGGAKNGKLPRGKTRFAAVHAEWSTRTRHLLTAINNSEQPVEAIILLGRLQRTPKETASLWQSKSPGSQPPPIPLVVPMSSRSCFLALIDFPGLLRDGIASSSYMPLALPLREYVAITFRVVLGAVAARWWEINGSSSAKVYFGITGTADTTLLERAIQKKGGHTTHVLHGQATGPNFIGFSNLALFRSIYDAEMYSSLACYGRCAVQYAPQPKLCRSDSGLLLLSNLAHPMNPDFAQEPLQDELTLLACVGRAARKIGLSCRPLLWKPHPVIEDLAEEDRAILREAAFKEGFAELPPETGIIEVAKECRWVLTSPSTVALDLLQAGCLTLLLDVQGSVLDTALVGLPQVSVDSDELVNFLQKLDDKDAYLSSFSNAYSSVGPACVFDFVSGYVDV